MHAWKVLANLTEDGVESQTSATRGAAPLGFIFFPFLTQRAVAFSVCGCAGPPLAVGAVKPSSADEVEVTRFV